MSKKKLSGIIIAVVVLLVIALALFFGLKGCAKDEPVTQPNGETEPADTTPEPTETDPEPSETEPEPTETEPVIIQTGTIQKHEKGKSGDLGIYFKMEPNDVPIDTTWATEFRPTSKDAIQLIRGGETYDIGKTAAGMVIKYSETEYFLKLEEFLIRDYFPIQNNDIIVLNGIFRHMDTMFQIDTSYMLVSEGLVFYSTEYPEGGGVNVKYVGHPTSHPNGKTTDGIYFTLDKNSVPFKTDWSLQYSPASEDAVQLIRDGKTYNIGNTAAETIVKYSDTEYYLKTEQWIIKDFYPIRDGDIIVLNGKFVNSGVSTVFNISKTYISINEGLLTFSTEYPTESTVEAVQIPTMQAHPNGFTGTGVYFRAEENALPLNTDWSVEYYPREASCIKLIRDGETCDIANVDAGTIVKYSDTEYYFKLEQWIYKNYFPFVDGDILVVEGKFVNAGLAGLMEIGKTYIAFSGGMAYFSTEYPDGPVGPTQIQGGTMSSHPEGWNSAENGGLWFKLDANDAPYAADWSLRYIPSAAANVKLIRDGVTYEVANTGAEMLVKYGETDYYLEFWPISQKPIVEGDVLIVEGSFVNAANNVVLVIDKTYITIENGQPVFTTDYTAVIEGGYMQPHANGFNTASGDGLYFTLAANEVPYDGWNVEYEPVSAASLQLIRDGQTYNIGIPSRGTIVKYSDTEYYLKLAAWTIGEYAPIVPGDTLVVEGEFKNADNGVIFNISRTVITVGENYSLTFTEEEASDNVIQAGAMQSHPNGWNTQNNKGMYFTLASNDVPYSDDWNTFYYPTTAKNIKLVRDGQTIDLAQTDREYIVKFDDTGYYLKLEKWTIGDYFPIVPGDMLVVEGEFTNAVSGVTFNISKSYIKVGENYVLTFETEGSDPEDPKPENHGAMVAHSENGWTATGGLYFTMAANDVPYGDWDTRYTPTSASNVKLIRDGQTYDVAHTERETIAKFSETEYYYEFWTLDTYKPIVAGDVMVVEGAFTNAANGATLNIAKTTITFNADGTATFETEGGEPEEPDVTEPENHGSMSAHSVNGWTATGGLYFTMAANDVPYGDWNIRYTPTSASNVKLIRDGQTYDVAHTERETIAKFSETEYYYEFWTLDTYKPIVAGDVMVVEGDFVNTANGATLSIAKTTITFNADGTATFVGQETQEPEESTAPSLTAHPNGWNTDNIYGTLEANDAPYDSNWSLRYNPASADVIKVVRNGETYSVGNPDAETLVKFSETEYSIVTWMFGDKKPVAGDVLIVEGTFINKSSGASIEIGRTQITLNADGTATFQSEGSEPEDPEVTEPENTGLVMKAWEEKAWNTSSNGGFWFTMDSNDIPADDTWALEYTPVSEDVLKLVRNSETISIGIPGRGTLVKASDAEYYLKLEWNIGDYANQITVGDQIIIEGDFTNAANGVTFTVKKTTVTIGENYALTFESEETETPEDDAIQVGTMTENSSGITDGIIYFSLADNELPSGLTKSDFRPVDAGVIKLIRDGVTYEIANPLVKTIVKQTASKYRLLRSALTMALQSGDILVVEGKFTGGNTDAEEVYTIAIGKTYIFIGDGVVTFSTELPQED